MKNVARGLGALGLLTTQTAAIATDTVLEPTSAWTLDYGDEKCSLTRDFGTLEEGLGLRIDSYGKFVGSEISLIGHLIPQGNLVSSPVKVKLLSVGGADVVEEKGPMRALHGKIGEYRFIQFSMSFVPKNQLEMDVGNRISDSEREAMMSRVITPNPDFEKSIGAISVALKPGNEVRFDTGPMGEPLKAMQRCIDDLLASWGLDPAVQRTLTRNAHPRIQSVKALQQNFPTTAQFAGTNGYVPIRLLINPDGSASSCVVQLPNAPEDLREAACKYIGTEFVPALDALGKPVASVYQTAVIYLLW